MAFFLTMRFRRSCTALCNDSRRKSADRRYQVRSCKYQPDAIWALTLPIFFSEHPLQWYRKPTWELSKADMVNIAAHGHNPVLSEMIVTVAEVMKQEAVASAC